MNNKILLFAIIFLVGIGQQVFAASYAWVGGGGDDDWGTGANWSPAAPTGGPGGPLGTVADIVTISGANQIDITSIISITSITINPGTGDQVSLNIPGDFTTATISNVPTDTRTIFSIPSGGKLTLGNGTGIVDVGVSQLDIAGIAIIDGNGAAEDSVNLDSADVNLSAGSQLNLIGRVTLTPTIPGVDGTITGVSTGSVVVTGNMTVDTTGVVSLADGDFTLSAGALTLQGSGLFETTATGVTTINGQTSLDGTSHLKTGLLSSAFNGIGGTGGTLSTRGTLTFGSANPSLGGTITLGLIGNTSINSATTDMDLSNVTVTSPLSAYNLSISAPSRTIDFSAIGTGALPLSQFNITAGTIRFDTPELHAQSIDLNATAVGFYQAPTFNVFNADITGLLHRVSGAANFGLTFDGTDTTILHGGSSTVVAEKLDDILFTTIPAGAAVKLDGNYAVINDFDLLTISNLYILGNTTIDSQTGSVDLDGAEVNSLGGTFSFGILADGDINLKNVGATTALGDVTVVTSNGNASLSGSTIKSTSFTLGTDFATGKSFYLNGPLGVITASGVAGVTLDTIVDSFTTSPLSSLEVHLPANGAFDFGVLGSTNGLDTLTLTSPSGSTGLWGRSGYVDHRIKSINGSGFIGADITFQDTQFHSDSVDFSQSHFSAVSPAVTGMTFTTFDGTSANAGTISMGIVDTTNFFDTITLDVSMPFTVIFNGLVKTDMGFSMVAGQQAIVNGAVTIESIAGAINLVDTPFDAINTNPSSLTLNANGGDLSIGDIGVTKAITTIDLLSSSYINVSGDITAGDMVSFLGMGGAKPPTPSSVVFAQAATTIQALNTGGEIDLTHQIFQANLSNLTATFQAETIRFGSINSVAPNPTIILNASAGVVYLPKDISGIGTLQVIATEARVGDGAVNSPSITASTLIDFGSATIRKTLIGGPNATLTLDAPLMKLGGVNNDINSVVFSMATPNNVSLMGNQSYGGVGAVFTGTGGGTLNLEGVSLSQTGLFEGEKFSSIQLNGTNNLNSLSVSDFNTPLTGTFVSAGSGNEINIVASNQLRLNRAVGTPANPISKVSFSGGADLFIDYPIYANGISLSSSNTLIGGAVSFDTSNIANGVFSSTGEMVLNNQQVAVVGGSGSSASFEYINGNAGGNVDLGSVAQASAVNVQMPGGLFIAPSGNFLFTGDNQSGQNFNVGTYSHNNGTFVGSGQVDTYIQNSITFYNLAKQPSTSGSDLLIFSQGAVVEAINTISLQGKGATEELYLQSDSAGNPFSLNIINVSNYTFNYVQFKDVANQYPSPAFLLNISSLTNTDGGGNTGWIFDLLLSNPQQGIAVSPSGDDATADPTDPTKPYASISAALAAAGPDERIYIAPGTYNETTPFVLNINYSIMLMGSGPDQTIVNYTGPGSYFQLNADNADLAIIDMGFENIANSTGDGSVLTATNGSWVEFSRCRFKNNSASGNGGVISMDLTNAQLKMGGIDLWDCDFIGNSSAGNGGALSLVGVPEFEIINCRFVSNSAFSGGAVNATISGIPLDYNNDPIVTYPNRIEASVFKNNTANFSGGALCLYGWIGKVDAGIENSVFVGNSAEGGGAISLGGNTNGDFNVRFSTFFKNKNVSNTYPGAAIVIQDDLSSFRVSDTIFWENTSTNNSSDTTPSIAIASTSSGTNYGQNLIADGPLGLDSTSNILNSDPLFVDSIGTVDSVTGLTIFDLHPGVGSPALDAADLLTNFDVSGKPRQDALPDIGAFEGLNDITPPLFGGEFGDTPEDMPRFQMGTPQNVPDGQNVIQYSRQQPAELMTPQKSVFFSGALPLNNI
jgi:hypothetical protein